MVQKLFTAPPVAGGCNPPPPGWHVQPFAPATGVCPAAQRIAQQRFETAAPASLPIALKQIRVPDAVGLGSMGSQLVGSQVPGLRGGRLLSPDNAA